MSNEHAFQIAENVLRPGSVQGYPSADPSSHSDSGFSLLGLSTPDSCLVVGGCVILFLALALLLLVVVTKRRMRLSVARGNVRAEVALNESARGMLGEGEGDVSIRSAAL